MYCTLGISNVYHQQVLHKYCVLPVGIKYCELDIVYWAYCVLGILCITSRY